MSEKLNRNVPKLRFPEFVVDWKKLTLISFVENIIDYRGKAPPKSEDGIILITARNVKQGFLDFSSKEFIPSEDYDSWMSRGLPQKGDILFTTEAPLGNVCMFPDSGVYALGQRTLTLRAKSGLSYGEFLFYILQSPKIRTEIFSKSTGSTAKGIKSSVFKKIPLQVPSVEEQKKIANFLGAIATRLTQLRRKHELLQTYKRGVMQKIFSQEVRFKGAIGGAFPDWKRSTLKELEIEISDGNYGELYPNQEDFQSEGIPFIRANNLKNGRITWDDMKFIDSSLHKTLKSGHLLKNDILITTRGDIGTIALVGEEFQDSNINAQLCLLRNPKACDKIFLFHFLLSENAKKQLLELTTGSALKQLPRKNLLNLIIYFPCLEEQEKIADFLTAIDRKIEAVAQQIDRTKQFKKGLLQKMFV